MTQESFRQRSPRIKQNLMVRYRVPKSDQWRVATLRNFSVEGACLVCEDAFEKEALIELEIGRPLFTDVVATTATVCWTKAPFGNSSIMEGLTMQGVIFNDLSEAARKNLIKAVERIVDKEKRSIDKHYVAGQNVIPYIGAISVSVASKESAPQDALLVGAYPQGAKLISHQLFPQGTSLTVCLEESAGHVLTATIDRVQSKKLPHFSYGAHQIIFKDLAEASKILAHYVPATKGSSRLIHKVAITFNQGVVAEKKTLLKSVSELGGHLIARQALDANKPVMLRLGKPLFYKPVEVSAKVAKSESLFSLKSTLFKYTIEFELNAEMQRAINATFAHYLKSQAEKSL